eukprot:TRINITY_DN2699_c0_g1_i1.p1 TRINITY_DN2699_c0_g1~~TRINITY_DN2699_c0_g1_i1.p1  ORF type:complete len:413 (+),score=96.03 TRINITY_DN2699_c0_g1_i1:49-1287(+)
MFSYLLFDDENGCNVHFSDNTIITLNLWATEYEITFPNGDTLKNPIDVAPNSHLPYISRAIEERNACSLNPCCSIDTSNIMESPTLHKTIWWANPMHPDYSEHISSSSFGDYKLTSFDGHSSIYLHHSRRLLTFQTRVVLPGNSKEGFAVSSTPPFNYLYQPICCTYSVSQYPSFLETPLAWLMEKAESEVNSLPPVIKKNVPKCPIPLIFQGDVDSRVLVESSIPILSDVLKVYEVSPECFVQMHDNISKTSVWWSKNKGIIDMITNLGVVSILLKQKMFYVFSPSTSLYYYDGSPFEKLNDFPDEIRHTFLLFLKRSKKFANFIDHYLPELYCSLSIKVGENILKQSKEFYILDNPDFTLSMKPYDTTAVFLEKATNRKRLIEVEKPSKCRISLILLLDFIKKSEMEKFG